MEGEWIRSSQCSGGQCVEVAFGPEFGSKGSYAMVRNSAGTFSVVFNSDEWKEFVAGVKRGEFDG